MPSRFGDEPLQADSAVSRFGDEPATAKDPGFWHGVMESLNPIPAIKQVVNDPFGPLAGLGGLIIRPAVDQGRKAVDAAKGRGEFANMTTAERLSETVGHGAAALLPGIGAAAANAGETIGEGRTREGLGQAAALLGSVAAPEIIRGAGKLVAPAGAPLEDALRTSAETDYNRVLAPTTKANKAITARVVPELIDRNTTALTLKGLQRQAQSQIASAGSAIGDIWDNLPAGTATELQPVYDHLQNSIDNAHSVPNAAGKLVPKGPEAVQAINNLTNLQQTLTDVAETDPATGKLVIPSDKLRSLRQYFDDIAARANRYGGADLASQSVAEAHGMAADGIRAELSKQFPDIAALNKEYSFWSNVNKVVTDTIARKTGQSTPLGVQAARAAGFAKAGPLGAEGMQLLTEAVRSPAWRTISAVTKDGLADAIAKGNSAATQYYIGQIGRATGLTANVIGQSQQSAQPALAGIRP